MNKGLEKFDKLVQALEILPSVGKKSALRMAYHMCMNDPYSGVQIAHAIESAIAVVKQCKQCGAMSENELCPICIDETRQNHKLCIVENAKDILIIEEHGLFDGRYFVLKGIDEQSIERLILRAKEGIEEIIFAMTPSIANDAVIIFIEDKLQEFDINFTKIAQGVPTGVSLENIDMLSLSRALQDRVKI